MQRRSRGRCSTAPIVSGSPRPGKAEADRFPNHSTPLTGPSAASGEELPRRIPRAGRTVFPPSSRGDGDPPPPADPEARAAARSGEPARRWLRRIDAFRRYREPPGACPDAGHPPGNKAALAVFLREGRLISSRSIPPDIAALSGDVAHLVPPEDLRYE